MEMALLMMVQTHYWMKNWRGGDLSGGRLSRGRRKDHDISNRVNSYTVQKNIIEKKSLVSGSLRGLGDKKKMEK